MAIDVELQKRALSMYMHDESMTDIAQVLNISRSTLWRWKNNCEPEDLCRGKTWDELREEKVDAVIEKRKADPAGETLDQSRHVFQSILKDLPFVLEGISEKIKEGGSRVNTSDYAKLIDLYIKLQSYDDEKAEFARWFSASMVSIVMDEVVDTSARERIKARFLSLEAEAKRKLGDPLIKSPVN